MLLVYNWSYFYLVALISLLLDLKLDLTISRIELIKRKIVIKLYKLFL